MSLTGGYRVKLYGQSEGLVCAALVTLTHATEGIARISTDPTQRVTTDPIAYGTVSRGETYLFAPVEIILPLDEPESEPASRLSITNVDRRLVTLIRSVEGGITATIELIDPADPDTVQREFSDLEVVSASYDAQEITIGMRVNLRQHEPFPKGRFTPSGFPGLF